MPSLASLLARALERAGLSSEPGRLEALERYLVLLARWGRRLNLTAVPEPEHVLERLLPDAFRLARALPPSVHTVIDVGSGSGLIGVPLAVLCPALELALLEPSAKRCSFLRTAVQQLGLNATIHEGRLEQLAPGLAALDLACCRATWPPAEWLRRAVRLLQGGGQAVAFLARDAPPSAPGFELTRVVDYALDDGSPRRLAFYSRCFT